jgi:2-dehydro-3-deoxyphosphogluconate aldolase/(4S)-4-hydroxy-2-oxoglutarate aldolase
MISQSLIQHDLSRETIRENGLVAILRGDFSPDRTIQIAQALQNSGIKILEVTLNSSGALHLIGLLRKKFPEQSMLIGAGTVRSEIQLKEAVQAGAAFTVAPNCDERSISTAIELGILHVPGVFTPTEAVRAVSAGSRVVKLFPVDQLGPSYLKALRAPLDNIDFIPTGGVDTHNIADYFHAGAFAVGIGSALVTGANQKLREIEQRGSALVRSWRTARDA